MGYWPNGGGRSPVLAVAASLLLHALLLAALLNAPLRPLPTGPEDRVITMHLTPRPSLEPVQEVPPVEPQPEPQPEPRAEPADEPETPEPSPATATADAGPVTEDPAMLRARILEQVEARPNPPGAEPLPWTSSGDPVPGLPGVRGWIAGHVGPVRPGADTWKENDGSSRGRYVLASGTVICTRRRGPTIDELMNPWKSTAVTMFRICGRERPEAPDFSDPRVQPPPTRIAGRTGDE